MDDEKPRSRNVERIKNVNIFKMYNNEMEGITQEFANTNINETDIKFHLFQTIDNSEKRVNMIFNVFNFYDNNFIGNKDFIQIPNLKNVIENVTSYPMIIAARNITSQDEEILGITTIKLEENSNITDNPYFPTINEKVLSITGILTKLKIFDEQNNRIKGIGKNLYKVAIQGAYNINKYEKIRLMCKIDCRNESSIKSLVKAVEELQQEGKNIQILLSGYYEILDKYGKLTEAPTFTFEITLNANKTIENDIVKFSYLQCREYNLLNDIANVISTNTYEQKRYITCKDNNTIIYHKISAIDASKIRIEVGKSADGNNRIIVGNNIVCKCVEGDK